MHSNDRVCAMFAIGLVLFLAGGLASSLSC